MRILFLIAALCPSLAFGAILNVTNYGAIGNVISFRVTTTSNSLVVTTTNLLSAADVGKVVSITGAGVRRTATNEFSDLVALISSVAGQTNITLNRPAACATNQAEAKYGTDSAPGFQAAVNAAANGDTIQVPAGTYFVIPTVYDTNWLATTRLLESAVSIYKGGFSLVGAGANTTKLLGNGAWQFTGTNFTDVYRGFIASFKGGITNDGPVLFSGLTFDGGVPVGDVAYKGFPANSNGDGWDLSHGAILSVGAFPHNTNKSFSGCNFVHWRGEMVKDTIGFPALPGVCNFTNCIFGDGNASGINVNFGGTVTGNLFTNLTLTVEVYQGFAQNPFNYVNNVFSNCDAGITVVGAHSNQFNQPFLVSGNTFDNTAWAVIFGPSQNLTITSNVIKNLSTAIMTSTFAYQSVFPTINSNILVSYNSATNVFQFFYNGGCDFDALVNMTVNNNTVNTLVANGNFATGFGCSTNVRFFNNLGVNLNTRQGLNSANMTGQYYIDDFSNQFPWHNYDDFSGVTNALTYAFGYRQLVHAANVGSVYYLDDSFPSRIPTSVSMVVSNSSGITVSLYRTAAMTGTTDTLTNNAYKVYSWTGSSWQDFPYSEWRMGTLILLN